MSNNPEYHKLRLTELEIKLFKHLAVAYNKLELLSEGRYPEESKPTKSRYRSSSIYDQAEYFYDQEAAARNFAEDIAQEIVNNLDDDDWEAFDAIRSGDLR